MIFPNRVSALAAIGGIRSGSYYSTASPGGPVGSTLFTMLIVVTFKRIPVGATEIVQRYTAGGATDGWTVETSVGGLQAGASNATPAYVATPILTITASMVGTPLIIIVRYNGVPNPGNIQGWNGGVSFGTTALGTGYASTNAATRVGVNSAGNTPLVDGVLHEFGFLDGYDVQASYNTGFGTGAAGWNAQLVEDFQQGRYPTWPRAAVANSDWLWSARDAALGNGGTVLSWTDRYSSVVMTRTGAPQSTSIPARFA